MKRARYFQIDAFTRHLFEGNPAGVCLLDAWPDDALLQKIAAESNQPETAFLVPLHGEYELRWFTSITEVDLCGHATLAAAHLVFTELKHKGAEISFQTKCGTLNVKRSGELMIMDFPARPATPIHPPPGLLEGLGKPPREVLKARDVMCVYATEEEVLSLQPRFDLLSRIDCLGIIATAPGHAADFVSRFFAPRVGIFEDPVTGSAHCTLVPYWSNLLGKKELLAHQASRRGGELYCTERGSRVLIAGYATTYLDGHIRLG